MLFDMVITSKNSLGLRQCVTYSEKYKKFPEMLLPCQMSHSKNLEGQIHSRTSDVDI